LLNRMSDVTTAADLRGPFSVGALSRCGTGTSGPGSAVAFPRHGAYWAGCVSGKLRILPRHDMAFGQQNSSKQHDAITTPVAAVRGGALGSHPAREPVPV
jgi:hypothetical protein